MNFPNLACYPIPIGSDYSGAEYVVLANANMAIWGFAGYALAKHVLKSDHPVLIGLAVAGLVYYSEGASRVL